MPLLIHPPGLAPDYDGKHGTLSGLCIALLFHKYRLKHALRAVVDILFLSPRAKEQYIHYSPKSIYYTWEPIYLTS